MAADVYYAADRCFQPWRNGGGETAEVLVWPLGAGLDNFEWRISTARVDRSGPFSLFPNVDRVLAVIEGGSMRLDLGGASLDVGPDTPPIAFSGDVPCQAVLEGGPLLDLNVMVRRPRRAALRRTGLSAWSEASRAFALLLADAGRLARLDVLDLAEASAERVRGLAGAPVLLILIDPR